jgi:hypothetical protein
VRSPFKFGIAQINPLQASAESTLLEFIVTKPSGGLGLDIFNDLGPNGWGEPGRFQHPPEQARRQPGFFVVPVQDAPRRAAWQGEYVGLLIKSLKSSCDKRIADASYPA